MTLPPKIIPILALCIAPPAHAYIDPVSGSLILQGIIAAFAAIMLFMRNLRQKVLGLFGKGKKHRKSAGQNEDDSPEENDHDN